jgi:hypothetical protein
MNDRSIGEFNLMKYKPRWLPTKQFYYRHSLDTFLLGFLLENLKDIYFY